MQKFMFVLILLLGVAAGIYLGLKYPPDIVCGILCEQAESPTDSTAFESFSPNTLTITPTPSEINEEQFHFDATPDPSTTITTTPAPSNSDAESDSNDILGQLIIGSDSITVRNNVDEATLHQSPGWMPDSALPGEDGMCVILGHRNRNHLKVLENVEVGDEIIFRYVDNRTTTYTVKEIQIFEKTADWTLPQSDENSLVIVTCYPFRYSGSAPGKFQVVCV
jgi:sortase A